jgi:hypothetical protein
LDGLRIIPCGKKWKSSLVLWKALKRQGTILRLTKHLKFGPLLVAAVEASPSGIRDLQSINKLDLSPDEGVDQENTHGNS